jgi:hypothetical protein
VMNVCVCVCVCLCVFVCVCVCPRARVEFIRTSPTDAQPCDYIQNTDAERCNVQYTDEEPFKAPRPCHPAATWSGIE